MSVMTKETHAQATYGFRQAFAALFAALSIRIFPILRHKQEAEMLTERIQEMNATAENERAEREALVTRSKELEGLLDKERERSGKLSARIEELNAIHEQMVSERKIERFDVRQGADGMFRVHTHVCPRCHSHHGELEATEDFEKARVIAEYRNRRITDGMESKTCEECASTEQFFLPSHSFGQS